MSSSGETAVQKLERMQSKVARYVLGKSRRNWSRTDGYEKLGWLTIPQMAVEATMRLFYKVIMNMKPEKIYESVMMENREEVRRLSRVDLNSMTKISRKTWLVRSLRYYQIMPRKWMILDPTRWLKNWIPKDGDEIFKGKVDHQEDWLWRELEDWDKWQKETMWKVIDDDEDVHNDDQRE